MSGGRRMLMKGIFEHVSATVTFTLNEDFIGNWTIMDHKLPYAIDEGRQQQKPIVITPNTLPKCPRDINRSWLQSLLVRRTSFWEDAEKDVFPRIHFNL